MTSTSGGSHDLIEMDVEAVAESQHLAGLQVGLDGLVVEVGLVLVLHQDHDHVGNGRGLGRVHGLEAVFLGQLPVGAAFALADDHLHSGVAEVLGMGMALGAVADDGHGFIFQKRKIGVLIVEKLSLKELLCASRRGNSCNRGTNKLDKIRQYGKQTGAHLAVGSPSSGCSRRNVSPASMERESRGR